MALSFVAQSARGIGRPPVPQREVDKATSIPERFLIRWRGEADPRHVKAIDAYWISAAEHGMNASTFTARVIASTGADVAAALSGAVGALSGPLHGGAPSRVLQMLDERRGARATPSAYVKELLDRGDRLMGFGHRVYRAEDPRARVLRRTAQRDRRPAPGGGRGLEKAALAELKARKPDRVLATNVEFWSAVVLDFADVPPELFTPLFSCARVGGWAAHIMEQKREAKLIRPTAKYVGPGAAARLERRTAASRALMEAATTEQRPSGPTSAVSSFVEVAVPGRDPRGARLPVPQARRAPSRTRSASLCEAVREIALRRRQGRGGALGGRQDRSRRSASAACSASTCPRSTAARASPRPATAACRRSSRRSTRRCRWSWACTSRSA